MANTGFGSPRCDTKRFTDNYRQMLASDRDLALLGTAHSALHDLRNLIAPDRVWRHAVDDQSAIQPIKGSGWIIEDSVVLTTRYRQRTTGNERTLGAKVSLTAQVVRDGIGMLIVQSSPVSAEKTYLDLAGEEQTQSIASRFDFQLSDDPLDAPIHPGYYKAGLPLRHLLGRTHS